MTEDYKRQGRPQSVHCPLLSSLSVVVSRAYALSSKMFSAPAVAAMLNEKKNLPPPIPKTKPVNMGPASSAAEAFKTQYGNKESPERPKKVKKVYHCLFCTYSSEYQHNRNRHEALVHGVVVTRTPDTTKKAPEMSLPKEGEPELDQGGEEKQTQEVGKKDTMAESKKRKEGAIAGPTAPPQKKAKEVDSEVKGMQTRGTPPIMEEKAAKPTKEERKDKETMTEEECMPDETKGVEDTQWLKLKNGKVVVVCTDYAVLHICS